MRPFPHHLFIALCLVLAVGGCGIRGAARSFETADRDQGCASQCEQRWQQCVDSCPQDAGAQFGCRLKVCNPGRGDCLMGCPSASFP
jgi:hypothetical protein